jgi:recombination protein RecR
MHSLNRLAELFERFPGIGPRQARRFVYFLLRQSNPYLEELVEAIRDAKKNVKLCSMSYVYFYAENPNETLSPLARDESRDKTKLLVVEKDSDVENIERIGGYNGHYFVLGGIIPVLDNRPPEDRIRLRELQEVVRIRSKEGLKEIILATSATSEGDATLSSVRTLLEPLSNELSFTISTLGRGLSTGTELEYIDRDTLSSALENRHKI